MSLVCWSYVYLIQRSLKFGTDNYGPWMIPKYYGATLRLTKIVIDEEVIAHVVTTLIYIFHLYSVK